MLKKLLFPLIFGLCGLVVLLSLGTWQIQRLAWKNNLIGDIQNSIRMAPTEIIPRDINPTSQYLSKKGKGYFLEEELHILHSLKPYTNKKVVSRIFVLIKRPKYRLPQIKIARQHPQNANTKLLPQNLYGFQV